MSTQPEHAPEGVPATEPAETPSTDPLALENTPAPPPEWTSEPEEQPGDPSMTNAWVGEFDDNPPRNGPQSTPSSAHDTLDQPLFLSYTQPLPPAPREERIPHFGHLGLLGLLVLLGWLGAGLFIMIGLRAHLWGITNLSQAATDYHYTLASQAAQYLITFGACLLIFPIIWRKPFFDGIHWRGRVALERVARLISASVLCFFVAMINGMLMPGPTNAPIDQLFKAPGAAWVLFAFGVTLAPFFEEMAFRGFILPAICTAWDWGVESFTGAPRRPLAEDGSPNWSLSAMIFGSVITSVPFALMHGVQTAWSLGPFLLLIFVSLVLCWVRLRNRSLAASTIVHSCYNFMLFAFMLLGTGGFKHLDKM